MNDRFHPTQAFIGLELDGGQEYAFERSPSAELESLDAQLRDIDTFEQVVAAFFEEYMNEEAAIVPAASILEQSRATSPSERSEPSTQAPQDAPSLALQIRQTILPNFKVLPRAERLIGVSSG